MVSLRNIEDRIYEYMLDSEPNPTKFAAIGAILDQANVEGNQEAIDEALIYAIADTNPNVVRLIIEKGGNVNFITPGEYQSTPLINAAINQNNLRWREEMVNALLDAGADPSLKVNDDGEKTVNDLIATEIELSKNRISRENNILREKLLRINNNTRMNEQDRLHLIALEKMERDTRIEEDQININSLENIKKMIMQRNVGGKRKRTRKKNKKRKSTHKRKTSKNRNKKRKSRQSQNHSK